MSDGLRELIISWIPVVVIFTFTGFFIRRALKLHRASLDLHRDIVTVNQTMSETLIRIEKLLEDRNA